MSTKPEIAVTVTIFARGDNENTPADAVHHALAYAHKAGFIEAWSEPASGVAQRSQEPDAWQWRACIGGQWGAWLCLDWPVERFIEKNEEHIERGVYELRPLYAALSADSPHEGEEAELFAAVTKEDLPWALKHLRDWTAYIDEHHRKRYADLIENQAKLITWFVEQRRSDHPQPPQRRDNDEEPIAWRARDSVADDWTLFGTKPCEPWLDIDPLYARPQEAQEGSGE